jgi:hypothetical protein
MVATIPDGARIEFIEPLNRDNSSGRCGLSFEEGQEVKLEIFASAVSVCEPLPTAEQKEHIARFLYSHKDLWLRFNGHAPAQIIHQHEFSRNFLCNSALCKEGHN